MSFWMTAYEEHGPDILAYLSRRLRAREEAEDILQETFVKAMGAQDRLRDRGRLRSYLFTIAHHQLVNHVRRSKMGTVAEAELPAELSLEEMAQADATSTDDALHLRDLVERLGDILPELSEPHRRAFELAVLDDLSYAEVAERMGWTRAQVKINVFRARRKIVDRLGDELLDRGEKR